MIYAIFQGVVIALVVAWSVWFAARRLFPRSYRRGQAALARRLAASSYGFLRSLGDRITPLQVASGAGCGSGGGCSSCGACVRSSSPSPGDGPPLALHPRAKS
ncbi:MAG: DUF6587 family protein [Rudaea sp.]